MTRTGRLLVLLLATTGSCVAPSRSTHPPVTASQPPAAPPADLGGSVHVALGIPRDADDSDDLLLDRQAYVASYNPRRNVANWVAWNLDDRYLGREDRQDRFHADDGLPIGVYRVTPHDYAKSGYDRGHLCPSADRTRSHDENVRTFLMTNMHPQVPELNRGAWKKLEEHERALAKRGKELFIVAGAIFGDRPILLAHGVTVPAAEYKIIVILERGQGVSSVTEATESVAVVMPNDLSVKDRSWTEFTVSIDDVERTTGYDFLPRVPPAVQAIVEARGAR